MKINSKTANNITKLITPNDIVPKDNIYVICAHGKEHIGPVDYISRKLKEMELDYPLIIRSDGKMESEYDHIMYTYRTWNMFYNGEASIRMSTEEERRKYVDIISKGPRANDFKYKYRIQIHKWLS